MRSGESGDAAVRNKAPALKALALFRTAVCFIGWVN